MSLSCTSQNGIRLSCTSAISLLLWEHFGCDALMHIAKADDAISEWMNESVHWWQSTKQDPEAKRNDIAWESATWTLHTPFLLECSKHFNRHFCAGARKTQLTNCITFFTENYSRMNWRSTQLQMHSDKNRHHSKHFGNKMRTFCAHQKSVTRHVCMPFSRQPFFQRIFAIQRKTKQHQLIFIISSHHSLSIKRSSDVSLV